MRAVPCACLLRLPPLQVYLGSPRNRARWQAILPGLFLCRSKTTMAARRTPRPLCFSCCTQYNRDDFNSCCPADAATSTASGWTLHWNRSFSLVCTPHLSWTRSAQDVERSQTPRRCGVSSREIADCLSCSCHYLPDCIRRVHFYPD